MNSSLPFNKNYPFNHLDYSTISYKTVEFISENTYKREISNLSINFDLTNDSQTISQQKDLEQNITQKQQYSNLVYKENMQNQSKELFSKQIVNPQFIRDKMLALQPMIELD